MAIRSAARIASSSNSWRVKSRHATSCPAARSHAAGETSPNGCRPNSYVEIKTIFTVDPVYRRAASRHELLVLLQTGIFETHCGEVSRPSAPDAGYTCGNDGESQDA